MTAYSTKAIDGAVSEGAEVRVVRSCLRGGLSFVAELHVDGYTFVPRYAPTATLALEVLERALGVMATDAIRREQAKACVESHREPREPEAAAETCESAEIQVEGVRDGDKDLRKREGVQDQQPQVLFPKVVLPSKRPRPPSSTAARLPASDAQPSRGRRPGDRSVARRLRGLRSTRPMMTTGDLRGSREGS